MQEQVNGLEKKLADLFKSAPKMPEGAKKFFVAYMTWASLVLGILQLWAAVALWNLGYRAHDVVNFYNKLAETYGVGNGSVHNLSLFYWLSVIFIAVSGVMALMAFPGLKAKKKVGWNWVFYASLVNLAYGVSSVFMDSYYGGGASRLISSLIGSAIGFWILFSIRDAFMPKKS